ncbi:MAG: chorismate lyase [Rhodocyclaceae bacterium]
MQNSSRRSVWRDRLLHTGDNRPYIPWLRDRGSLTARIQARGRFAVRLLRKERALPTRDEAAVLGISAGELARVREVALLCNGEAVIFAHTVLPCHPRGPLTRWLARIGTRSLGSLLFANPGFLRGEIDCKRLDARHPLFAPALKAIGGQSKTLWARRSLFRFGRQAVLVTEVYSPALCGQ